MSIIWAAIQRFRELHQQYKAGALTSAEARAQYETERDDFVKAVVRAQQLTLRAGQSPRQALRITRAERLVLLIGPRREGTITVDIGSAGFAALVGPLAVRIVCDFELGLAPEPVTGRARVVASTKEPDGSYRTSFTIDWMSEEDRKRLDIAIIDAALEALPRR